MAEWSNAPCLYTGDTGRCYNRVIPSTGYCKEHQKPPFENAHRENIPGWANIKKNVLRRDKYVCYICGGYGADQVDHIKPLSEGGSNLPMNLRAIHGNIPPYCHRTKSQEQTAAHKKRINTFKVRGKKD